MRLRLLSNKTLLPLLSNEQVVRYDLSLPVLICLFGDNYAMLNTITAMDWNVLPTNTYVMSGEYKKVSLRKV